MEKNVRAHSLYRGYSQDIPSYLHDRPHQVVKHCMAKKHLAEEFYTKQVLLHQSDDGMFKVQSSTQTNVWYTVRFDTPSCSCMSYQHDHLPCKHFFAVFKNYPEWGWEKLPLRYISSPTLTLDENVIPKQSISHVVITEANVDVDSTTVEATSTASQSPPQCESTTLQPVPDKLMPTRKRAHRHIGSECREILHEIKSMTYLVSDYDKLSVLKKDFIELHNKVSEACQSDSGILLELSTENEPKQKRRKITCQRKLKKKDGPTHSKIPKEESKKHKYSGRVGAKASMMRKLYKAKKCPVNVVDLAKKKKNVIVAKSKLPASVKNGSTQNKTVTTSIPQQTCKVDVTSSHQRINTSLSSNTTTAMQVPEWGGSLDINLRKIYLENTCPIDNWLVITYVILQLYPLIYERLSNMIASPGAKLMLRLYQLYKEKKFNAAKWYLAQLNNLPVRTTKEGAVVDFFGNEHNRFVRHLGSLFRHTSVSRCSHENCPHKMLKTDSSSNPAIVQISGTSSSVQHSVMNEIKSWLESEFKSQCLLKCTGSIPEEADISIMEGSSK